MDPPFVGGGDFAGKPILDELLDCPFAQAARCEGPHGRSLSLDFDDGIFNGLLGHSEVRGFLRLEDVS